MDTLKLTPERILLISLTFLTSLFDKPKPTPECHLQWWKDCCSDDPYVALAAPRGHAKSTAITFEYAFCSLLLREHDYIILVSNTQPQAQGFLALMERAIREIPTLGEFGIKPKLLKQNQGEIIGEFVDGKRFCVRAIGFDQQIRGLWWEGKRPNLVVCDDIEDKETVNSDLARKKSINEFMTNFIPALADDGKLRVVGTILHQDSILSNLLEDPLWTGKRYRAHNEDFTQILWPEKFSAKRLRAIKESFRRRGESDGYAQEYLNEAIDTSQAFFRASDLQLYKPKDIDRLNLTKYIVVDAATTEEKQNDPCAVGVFGVDHTGNIYLMDAVLSRMESPDLIDLIFDLVVAHKPEEVIMENGVISRAIGPFIYNAMQERNSFFVLEGITPDRSKTSRATSIRALTRAKKVFFNEEIDCLDDWLLQLKQFPKAKHDDAADVMAYIGLWLERLDPGKSEEEIDEEEYYDRAAEYFDSVDGRDEETGY